MTEHADHSGIPALTLGWRIKMAIDYGGVSREEVADDLGVDRATITRWSGDKGAVPRRAYLKQLALRTGVDYHWLETGQTPTEPEPDGGLSGPHARRDSNPKPSDPKVRGLRRVA